MDTLWHIFLMFFFGATVVVNGVSHLFVLLGL